MYKPLCSGAVIATVPGIGFDGQVETMETAEQIFAGFVEEAFSPDGPSASNLSITIPEMVEVPCEPCLGTWNGNIECNLWVPLGNEDDTARYHLACFFGAFLSQQSIMQIGCQGGDLMNGVLVGKADAAPFSKNEIEQVSHVTKSRQNPGGLDFTTVDGLNTLMFINVGGTGLRRFVYDLVTCRLQENYPCKFLYEPFEDRVSFIKRQGYAASFEFLRDSLGDGYMPFFRSSGVRILRSHIKACAGNNLRFRLQAFLEATPFLSGEEVRAIEGIL